MSDIVCEIHDRVCILTLNRVSKHNAFDDKLLIELQQQLEQAETNADIDVIVLGANGRHFSAGADLEWMQRMAHYSEAENIADANVLAQLMHTLHHSKKPTIAMVQGAAMGGGAGLVAACDIAIAADSATFCFSEVKLGLIPAVISPYVIKAIGARAATWLFMSAELIDAHRAQQLQLIHVYVPQADLFSYTLNYAHKLAQLAPLAVREAKQLVAQISGKEINTALIDATALLIAKKRVSKEGQLGLNAFIQKKAPNWRL